MIHEITRRIEFDAGHRIPNHDSKCKHLHGHRYALEATLSGALIVERGASSEGMVLDFSVLKQAMVSTIAEPWDHKLLLYVRDPLAVWAAEETLMQIDELGIVTLPSIPTVENLARLAYERIQAEIPSLKLTRVRLYETPNCWADYPT